MVVSPRLRVNEIWNGLYALLMAFSWGTAVILRENQPWSDLPERLQHRIDHGTSRAAPRPGDVCLLVKRFICSETLAQSPILALTEQRSSRVGLVPENKSLDLVSIDSLPKEIPPVVGCKNMFTNQDYGRHKSFGVR